MLSTGFAGAEHGDIPVGGSVRMRRMLRTIQRGRVDPTRMTTHRFGFGELERAFELMASKEEGIIKPLITFE